MMLPETVTAVFLVVCLATFFAVNLHNVVKFSRGRKNAKAHVEIRRPKSFTLSLAAFGTLLFFLESILFSFLAFTGFTHALHVFPLQLQFQYDYYLQIVGIVLTGAGYFLFIWSVVARGKYAVSWGMSENHRLVRWGPYRYVRHPSYLGYFLMFLGFFIIWLNLVALLPLVAVPGYVQVTIAEEELLIRRFGEEYVRYQKKTGRFFPKRKQS
jgi:protein-S-isoprenylcysteine O-methyltransferase Ste14